MKDDRLAAVRPYADRRAFGVTVALELFQAVRALRLLAFHDDQGRLRIVLVADENVRRLLVDGGAELDRALYGDAFRRIAVVLHEHSDIELADDFFRLGRAFGSSGKALQVGLAPLQVDFKDVRRARLEDRQGVRRTFQDVIYCRDTCSLTIVGHQFSLLSLQQTMNVTLAMFRCFTKSYFNSQKTKTPPLIPRNRVWSSSYSPHGQVFKSTYDILRLSNRSPFNPMMVSCQDYLRESYCKSRPHQEILLTQYYLTVIFLPWNGK